MLGSQFHDFIINLLCRGNRSPWRVNAQDDASYSRIVAIVGELADNVLGVHEHSLNADQGNFSGRGFPAIRQQSRANGQQNHQGEESD